MKKGDHLPMYGVGPIYRVVMILEKEKFNG